jgi:hypothetical protein
MILGLIATMACNPPQQTKLESNDTGLDDTGSDVDTEDTNDTDDTSDTNDTQDTQDTEESRIIAQEGTWNVTSVQLIEDSCGLGNYEDVTAFVPAQFQVSSADESGFNLDAQTRCDVDSAYQIECDSQEIEQDVLGGTATFVITNTFQGELEAPNDIAVDFNISLICEGLGCGVIELGLTGGFPCPVVLYANATPQ